MKLEKAIRREQKAEGPGQWSVVSQAGRKD